MSASLLCSYPTNPFTLLCSHYLVCSTTLFFREGRQFSISLVNFLVVGEITVEVLNS